jgi:hypothetical protein
MTQDGGQLGAQAAQSTEHEQAWAQSTAPAHEDGPHPIVQAPVPHLTAPGQA